MNKFLKNKKLLFVSIAVGVLGAAGTFFATRPVDASINDGRNCDTVSILYCGAHSVSEIKSKWNGTHKDSRYSKSDVTKVYDYFGIKQSDLTGLVEGVVMKDGRVIVGGKTVATEATTSGRWYNPPSGAKRISGTDRAYEFSTRHYTSGTGKTAFVKMVNGEFKWAVTKACGNPVKAKPVAKPKPQPQPTAACKKLDAVVTNRTRVTLKAEADAQNGAKISGYTYVIKNASGTTVLNTTKSSTSKTHTLETTISTPGNYTAQVTVKTSLGNKTATACKDNFKIEEKPQQPVAKCELLTITPISRTEFQLDAKAGVDSGATISGYTFVVVDSEGETVFNKKVDTEEAEASTTADVTTPGDYTAKVTVHTSLGDKTDQKCEAPLEVTEEEKPEEKLVKRCDVKKQKIVEITEEQAKDTERYKPVGDEACEEEEEVPPAELPKAGPAAIVGAGMGFSSVTAAGYYWLQSRRHLIEQMLRR